MTVAVYADEVWWQVHSHRPSSRTLIVAGGWFPPVDQELMTLTPVTVTWGEYG